MELSNEVSMVITITAWNQVRDTGRIKQMYKYFARSFHDGIHHFHGLEHKVQGRLPLIQRISFHSVLAFDEFVAFEILSGVTPVEYDPRGFPVHTD